MALPSRLGALRRTPWGRVADLAWLVLTRLREDVPAGDRRRLAELMRSSKGDPRRLSARERDDVRRILSQVDLRKLGRDAALRQAPFGRAVGRLRRR